MNRSQVPVCVFAKENNSIRFLADAKISVAGIAGMARLKNR
jgi:hypothetical protein